ncbi:phosphoenolpyruvate carboxykinase (ATP) 1-like [Arachis ipaensis]|uniref:phosphoenolpyruvate carboxykinase (ATP) 1-like n=1 Tax=Arachis ipaensis TaxID=130454 RepID=UPI000A2B49A7|nr:phosphoenolpyruvate carboxykinase (ATP) 1-like [Arachis ipaensis]
MRELRVLLLLANYWNRRTLILGEYVNMVKLFDPDLRYDAAKENTIASYPIEYIPNAKLPCVGPHPKNVILLACDAFGVLPPVSKLNLAQTMYHFISGYTALVCAGTEDGIKEPTVTFSAFFGAAFIMLHPTKYATMLAEKMEKHGATGWLVNTSWSGGRYGYGSRIKLPYTRKIIDAIHSGSLLNAEYKKTEIFGFEIPTEVEGVPSEILDPINAVSSLCWRIIYYFDKFVN